MTITFPRLRGTGTRRAVDKLAELRDENIKLLTRQAATDNYFALLVNDRNDVYAAWRNAEQGRGEAEMVVVCQEATIRDLERQVADLERRLNVGVLAEAAAAHTQEIDLRELQERFAAGAVVSLNHSPQAIDPANVPRTPWVQREPAA